MTNTDPGVTILGALATYNVVQNLILSEKAYVPANLAMTGACRIDQYSRMAFQRFVRARRLRGGGSASLSRAQPT